MNKGVVFVLILLVPVLTTHADEAIPITISFTIKDLILDGKWTHETEWKQSSLNTYDYGNYTIILRSAHQDDFVYILLDVIGDHTINMNQDRAAVCFDAGNKKTDFADSNDWCFVATLGGPGTVFRGNGTVSENNFQTIPQPENAWMVGAVSDQNDRYSKFPHTSYEFKISTDLIQRKDVYGFYFSVYDYGTNKYYTYPANLTSTELLSSPARWGQIYSPDKSLPEFSIPFLILALSLGFLIMMRHHTIDLLRNYKQNPTF